MCLLKLLIFSVRCPPAPAPVLNLAQLVSLSVALPAELVIVVVVVDIVDLTFLDGMVFCCVFCCC